MTLHIVRVYGTSEDVGAFHEHGQLVVVDGEPMVRMGHGVIVPRTGWHESEQAAREEAAFKIEAMAARLLAKAKEVKGAS